MKLAIALLLSVIAVNSFAHSGRTHSNGCHFDTSTNIEHCHNVQVDTPPSQIDSTSIIFEIHDAVAAIRTEILRWVWVVIALQFATLLFVHFK